MGWIYDLAPLGDKDYQGSHCGHERIAKAIPVINRKSFTAHQANKLSFKEISKEKKNLL